MQGGNERSGKHEYSTGSGSHRRLVGLLVTCLAFAGSTAKAQSAHPGASATGAASAHPVRAGTYPLTVTTAQMIAVIRDQLFTDSGRFYPCRVNTACQSWGHDVALSAPNITVDGSRVVFSVHMTGTYALNQFVVPRVAGDLIVSGVPVLHGNNVGLTQSDAQAGGASDMTFRAFVEATRSKIQSTIDGSPGFNLADYLVSSTADPQLPPPRLPGPGCVKASQIQVKSIATQPNPAAVGAVVVVAPPPATTGQQHC